MRNIHVKLFEIWTSGFYYFRRCDLKKKFTHNGRMTDDGQKPITIAYLRLGSGELTINFSKYFTFKCIRKQI